MKTAILLLSLFIRCAAQSLGSEQDLLSYELEEHLGGPVNRFTWTMKDGLTVDQIARSYRVGSWISKIPSQDSEFRLEVLQVVSGKVGDTLLEASVPRSMVAFTRAAVLTGGFALKRISLHAGNGPWHHRTPQSPISPDVLIRLPPVISEGDYILGCDFDAAIYLPDKRPRMEDVKNGLVLRVTRRFTTRPN